MTVEHYVEDQDLSVAWARAVRPMLVRGGASEIVPLVVAITGFEDGVVYETPKIRAALDQTLEALGKRSCETVASTIFPQSMWNPAEPRGRLFARYWDLLPRLKAAEKANRRGLYFERMITGGPPGRANQLDFVLDTYTSRQGARRGGLQVSVFDPARDHTRAARVGFPCLQQVTFAPTPEGLSLNAIYATQYAISRAYGNYLGLCRLGRFVAHELGLPLVRMTCLSGISLRVEATGELRTLAAAIDAALEEEAA